MEPILQVNHLKKVFHQRGKRDVAAVNDVSFCLYPGEILGIVGESGSGKSTVAKLITRLEDVTDGQIILDGQDISHSKGAARKGIYEKIQMVFQNDFGDGLQRADHSRQLHQNIRAVLTFIDHGPDVL